MRSPRPACCSFLICVTTVVTLALAGCSTGKSTVACQDYTDCPKGQFCGADKFCSFDCLSDTDCAGGTCNEIGQCVDVKPDSGPAPYLLTTDGGPTPDSAPDSKLPTDSKAPMDTRPPDTTGMPDMPPPGPDLITPDTTPQDGPLLVDGPVQLDSQVPLSCAAAIGTPCTQNSQCGPSATCLITDSTANRGVCTCTCIPDDPATKLVIEDDCPELWHNTCAKIALTGGTTKNYCLRSCSPKLGSNGCSGDLACLPRSGGVVGQYDKAFCLLYGCASSADCPVVTSTLCDTSTTPCASGQTCIPVLSGQTAGNCAVPGVCDTISGLCKAHAMGKATAKVGDPCRDDTECGDAMQCMLEVDLAKYRKKYLSACSDDDECCSGTCQSGACTQGLCTVNNRNGYCTIVGCTFASTLPIRACPAGSSCSRFYPGGRCLRTCSLTNAASCRGHSLDLLGDYECRAWNNLTLGGIGVTTTPVCEPGPRMTCDLFASSSTLDCTSVGNTSNTTQMTCRGLDNKVKTNKSDPDGFCLDNTSSGSSIRSPLP